MRQQTDQRFVPAGARAVECPLMDVRASDAERDVAVNRLREAAAEGRLTLEELTDRIKRLLMR